MTTEDVDRASHVGPRELKDPRSREYAMQTVWALKRHLESRTIDDRRVNKELAEIETYRHWEVLGYPSRDALLEAEIGHTFTQIQDVCEQARQRGAVGAQGGDRRSARAKQNQVQDMHLKKPSGSSARHLSRRLLRDAPDIFAALERGEYTSVRAAAKAAGIIRDKTPLEQLRHWWGKSSHIEQERFRAEIQLDAVLTQEAGL